MKAMRVVALVLIALVAASCGSGSTTVTNSGPGSSPPPGSAQVSFSLHDTPPMGVTVLSFQATITGMVLQPGNVPVLGAPMSLEMTQLQGMSAYLATISVPAGTYTGMTVTLANAQMTFLNDTGGMMGGGMMGGGSCANGQVCQFNPPMTTSSVAISGPPFPLTVQANTPFNLQMDFDLMDSMQSNMGMNPMMSSAMQQASPGSSVMDEMDDMLGQVASVNASGNQFTLSFLQGMPSMTLAVDANTTFQNFDSFGKSNNFSGLSQGQIVLMKMQLMAGGSLRAETIRCESTSSPVVEGMIVAVNAPAQFDMVTMNEAPAFQGLNLGGLVRINLQGGTTFTIDDTDLPVTGMHFASVSDMMIGQVVQIQPPSALISGTPPQLSAGNVRLMKAWVTGTVASKIDANTFALQNLPGMFGAAGISTSRISTSTQTDFENVPGVASLNVGDSVSVRGPLFMMSGTPTLVASKVQKR